MDLPEWLPSELKEGVKLSAYVGRLKAEGFNHAYGYMHGSNWSQPSAHLMVAERAKALLSSPFMEQGWNRITELGISPLDFYYFVESCQANLELFAKSRRMTPSAWSKHETKIKKKAKELAELVQGTPYDFFNESNVKNPKTRSLMPMPLSSLLAGVVALSPEDVSIEPSTFTTKIGDPNRARTDIHLLALELAAYLRERAGNPEERVIVAVIRSIYGSTSIDSEDVHGFLKQTKNRK